MEIKTAEFVTSMADYGKFPGKGLPQIAVAGKSNVGKSTLINRLCRRNKLARTSSTPGKTRLLNVFLLNGEFHLVDPVPQHRTGMVNELHLCRQGASNPVFLFPSTEVCLLSTQGMALAA